MKLTDPWFEAEFYGDVAADGSRHRRGVQLDGAQGLFLWCPCSYGNDKRAHGLIVPFANPQGAPACPADHGPINSNPGQPRPPWAMSGTGLQDLTLSPSIDVGADHCWHGYITNGEIT